MNFVIFVISTLFLTANALVTKPASAKTSALHAVAKSGFFKGYDESMALPMFNKPAKLDGMSWSFIVFIYWFPSKTFTINDLKTNLLLYLSQLN